MSKFKSQILFTNINYLLKKKKIKIGDFEQKVGVSPGYLSRASKDLSIKPGIDFIFNASIFLNVSIDLLLKIDLSTLYLNSAKMNDFIIKLKSDTINNKVVWKEQTINYLKDEKNISTNPLFVKLSESEKMVFHSNSFKNNTIINDSCFYTSFSNGVEIYLMSISKNLNTSDTIRNKAYELWAVIGEKKEFLYGTGSLEQRKLINLLYKDVSYITDILKVDRRILYAINDYMKD